MRASIKSSLRVLLQGVAWLLFVAAGIAFFVGGRAISEFAKTDRMLAEVEGFFIAAVCAGFGAIAKAAGEYLAEGGDGTSTSGGTSPN
jgi:hypothetical protein